MPELETGLPNVRQVQSLIREGVEVELKLVTNDLLTGAPIGVLSKLHIAFHSNRKETVKTRVAKAFLWSCPLLSNC
ncbi:Hfq-like protein [Leptolyngbya sp. 7M]|uniref:Hfq-like protein n=1 Tax=Leptolyngbya sp. 7M TaxID=2812896 RepID=UPI001B8BCAFC|nr:hypothetical protein [Leptolyngbya sp. 7M]QYO63425.1 hypothetical protein JVX88_26530 [Leptolyngbya sp. 7M]